jgi:predicted MFS family arabinose efflux permease
VRSMSSPSRTFNRIWAGETASFLGVGVGQIAIPVLALEELGISVLEFGVLNALTWLPFVVLTLPLGVLADSVRLRPLLLISQTGRVLLLLSLPILMSADALTFPVLLVLVAAVGSLNVLFEVSFFAFVPLVVGPGELVSANAKLYGSQSFAMVAGPALGAAAIAVTSPAVAVGVNGLAYAFSLLAIMSVRVSETRGSWQWFLITERVRRGVSVTLRTPHVRAVLGQSATYNLYYFMALTMLFPYLLDVVGVTPGAVARVLGMAGVAALVGAWTAPRLASRIGHGRAILSSACCAPVSALCWPLAQLTGGHDYALLVAGWALLFLGASTNNVLATSLRQAASPPGLMSSANAVYRLIVWGVTPLGSLAAGYLVSHGGYATGATVACLIVLGVPLWIATSSVPGVRTLDEVRPCSPERQFV